MALAAASVSDVKRKTAAFYFLRLREIIALELEAEGVATTVARGRWFEGKFA